MHIKEVATLDKIVFPANWDVFSGIIFSDNLRLIPLRCAGADICGLESNVATCKLFGTSVSCSWQAKALPANFKAKPQMFAAFRFIYFYLPIS